MLYQRLHPTRQRLLLIVLSDGPIQYLVYCRSPPGDLCVPKQTYPVHLHQSHVYFTVLLRALSPW